nr:MAG TPA: hypothetical protein [Caudoviricetes sp.]
MLTVRVFQFQNFFIGFFLLSVIGRCICKSPGIFQREHIAINEVQIAAILCRDTVEVFQLTDVVCGHPAVLTANGVPVHAALVITTEQTLQIELHEILCLFALGQECPLNGLLPTDDPGVKRVFHKLKGLLLNIRKARLFQVTNHVWRHSENSSDFIDLEFSCFEKLRLFGRYPDWRIFHTFLKHCDFICVSAAAEGGLPTLPYTLRIFDGAGVFQHTAGCSTVSKELGSVFLTGNRHADSILRHCNGTVAHQTVKAESGNMKHIGRLKRDRKLLVFNGFIGTTVVGVVKTAVFISVHRHLVRHQRIQRNDLIFAVADNLGIGIAPQKQMGHEGLSEHERTHFRVRFIVEQSVQRLVEGFFLAATIGVSVEVQRKSRHSFCQDTDTGVHGSHLHGRPLGHGFAGSRSTHIKGVGTSGCAVFRLIPGFEQSRKDTHIESLPSYKQNASVIVDRSTGIIATADRAVECHNGRHGTIDFLCGFLLIRLNVSGRIGADEDIIHHPAQDRVTAVGNSLLQHQLHKLLGRWGHILEALPERNDRETHTLKVLHHLHGSPAVKSNLPDVEAFAKLLNKLLNVAVMNHVALGGLEVPLSLPHIIRHMVTPHSEFQVVLRYPEVRQDDVFVVLVLRWEHQNERRNIRCGGQVQTAVTDTAFQIILADGKLAFVPFIHGHPSDCLLDPLVQTKLSEGVLFAGVLLRRFTGILDLVNAYRDAEGGIGLFPDLRVRPIIRFLCTIYNGVKGVVDLPAGNDVLRFLVYLVADGLRIVARCGDKEIQRLHSGVAGAFGHDIKQLAIGLRMQFVKHHTMSIETVLVAHIGRKHLVYTSRRLINEPLLGIQYLDPLGKCRTHPYHVGRHIEHDGCLLTVSSAAVNLGTFLTVTAGQQKSNGGSQFRLALFLGDFDICGIKLAIAVGLQCSENVSDDLFLPVDQLEGLSRPGAFGVAQAFYEHDSIIRCIRIVVGGLLHEPCGLVVFQFSRRDHLQGIKNSRHRNRCDLPYNEQQPLTEPLL